MGNNKTTNTTVNTPTPEETALNKQNLEMLQFMAPYQKQNYAALSTNINSILTGQTPMAQGIGGVNEQQTQSMVTSSLRDLYPQFQSQGLMDSGTAIQAGVRTAGDIRNSNAQFNVSAAQNLFNIATGGQSNLQSQATQLSSSLGNQLAGLRTTTSTQKSMNPFLMSFQQSLGSTLGSPGFSAGPFTFGG